MYSFAILFWEVITRKAIHHEWKQDQGSATVDTIFRPDLPDYVPPVVSELVVHCWNEDPFKRPTIFEIEERMRGFGDLTFVKKI